MNATAKTIAYPVAASYDSRSGLDHYGLATTAEEARAIYTKGMSAEDAAEVGLPTITMIECSFLGRAGGKEPATGWESEIAAGYASAQDCGNVRKVCVETWTF